MQWNWQTGGQNAYDAAQNALNQNRQKMYNQNMDERQVGNGQDMMSWMQQANDAAQYQAQQEQAAAQQAQAEEAQRAEQINLIKSQIAELQKSIADKQIRLQNFDYGVNEIAAIEARKINSQDPTMIWRWQKQREDTANANTNIGITDAQKFENKANMLIQQRPSGSDAGIEQQIRNIESAIVEGQNTGNDVTGLIKKKEELEDKIYAKGDPTGEFKHGTSAQNLSAKVADTINNKKATKAEIDELLKNDDLSNDDRIKLNTKWRDLDREEKNAAATKELEEFVKSQGYNPKTLTPRMRETLKRLHKAKRGK